MSDLFSMAGLVEGLAAASADPRLALSLFGAAAKLRLEVESPMGLPWSRWHDPVAAVARDALPKEAADAAWTAGQSMSATQVLAEARGEGTGTGAPRVKSVGGLSRREIWRWGSWSPAARATRRSPSAYSSPSGRWRATSTTSSESSTSTPGPGGRLGRGPEASRGFLAPYFSVLSTMFHARFGSYAAGMERIASLTNLLTLAPSTTSRLDSIVGALRQFTLKCLKALAAGYVESCRYYGYWILTSPPPPCTPQPRR